MHKKIIDIFLSLAGIFILLGLFCISYTYPLTLGKNNILYSDYGKFYHSQHLFIEHKNIYSPIFFSKNSHVSHNQNGAFLKSPEAKKTKVIRLAANLNPPFFTLISFPLAYLRYAQALFLMTFLSLLAGSAGILLIQNKLNADTPFSFKKSVLLLIGFFSYFPTFSSLQFGQVSLCLFLPLALAWRAAHDQQATKAAIFLGFAASLKPFIGLFLFYFLMRKEWRALGLFIATILLCSLIAAIFLGPSSYFAYFKVCQQINWAASSWNVSLYGFLLRFIGGSEMNTPVLPLSGLFNFVYLFLSILGILSLLWFLRPQRAIPAQKKTDLDFSIILVSMLLLSPLGWMYYFPLLSIPFLILWNLSEKGVYPIPLSLSLATLLLLSNIPVTLIPTDEIQTHNVLTVFLSSGLYFAALMGLMALLFRMPPLLAKNPNPNFERIPKGLLLLTCVVVFLPAIFGIAKSNRDWIQNAAKYSKEYSLVAK
jgi:hypothetical protein